MNERVAFFPVELTGNRDSLPKELIQLAADINPFLESTKGTFKKGDLSALSSYGTYAVFTVTYEVESST